MVGKITQHIVSFLIKRKLVFIGLFALISAVLVLGLSRLRINEDLYAIFPDNEQFVQFNELIQKNALNKQLIFSVDATEEEQLVAHLDTLLIRLTTKFPGELVNVHYRKEVDEGALVNYLQDQSILELTQDDYRRIDEKLNSDSIAAALQSSGERMRGTSLFFMRKLVAKDPLGLFNGELGDIASSQSSGNVKDGILYSEDNKRAFLFATIALDFKNTDSLTLLNEQLTSFTREQNKEHSALNLDYFGTFQIAVENAQQIKRDTWVTSGISIVLILALLFFFFRQLTAPLYFILPAVFGVLSGLGVTGIVQPDVSAISLATASVLLGIVLDYSFHFFTHYKHSGSVLETVSEVSAPMIIGSFTTIAALGALLFTDSPVLQNFGLIALATLSGAVVFTLLFLPVFIDVFRIKIPATRDFRDSKLKSPRIIKMVWAPAALLATLFLLYQSNGVTFDADLNNLSYHTSELMKKEQDFTGLHPASYKKIYVVAAAESENATRQANEKVYRLTRQKKEDYGITEVLSLAPFLPSDELIHSAGMRWVDFWAERKDSTKRVMLDRSSQYNFGPKAFTPFYNRMESREFDFSEGENLAFELGLNNLKFEGKKGNSYITSVVIDRDKLSAFKNEVSGIEGSYIVDLASMAERMIETVQRDFNYLLVFSALLVFLSLLVVYGRIELALFAFFPMLVSWVWILGLTALLGISFNFVNVMVVTFIFGLGDDFSIFTTDGLIAKHKFGKPVLSSYRTAILLSGITTILGTGALIFAKHPAVHSIALISVVGITTILLVTVFIQPRIFHFFVSNRVAIKRVPVTLFVFIYSVLLFTYFFLGSLFLSILLITVIIPFPAARVKKKRVLNYLISKLAKSTLYAGVHVKKKILNEEKLDFSRPAILVANHSSFLDILMVLMIHPKTLIMVKSWVYNSPVFGLFIRYADYPFARDGAVEDLGKIKKLVDEGYSIAIFPEGTRSKDGKMTRFHKGAFLIAKELNLDIQPVLLLGANEVNPKNDILINPGELYVYVTDRISPDAYADYRQLAKGIKQLMLDGYKQGMWEHARIGFWQNKVLKNYIFKGPVLEWYVKVKWMLERNSFNDYDNLVGERTRIYDLGCGYGYLSYYLHYRNPERIILGLDYDEEKIAVAQHGIKHSESLHFTYGDIRNFTPDTADVFFLNDVLHYLTKEEQFNVLDVCLNQLAEGGLLIIREGLSNESRNFNATRFTEFMSTRVFKFNKTVNSLNFLSLEEIRDYAGSKGLDFSMQKHSKTTTNSLIVLTKRNAGE